MDFKKIKVYPNTFEFKSDNGNHYVEGILEVANYLDSVNDMVTEECIQDMAQQINGRNVDSNFSGALKGNEEHEQYFKGDNTIVPKAKIISAEIKSKNLFIRVQLNKHHTEFKNLWGSIQDGFIDAFSMEFKPKEYINTNINGKNIRVLNKIQLGGVALTGKPACEACKITDFFVKSKIEVDDMSNEDENGVVDDGIVTPEPTVETPEVMTDSDLDEIKSQLETLKLELASKDKELSEIKSKIETTVKEDKISKDEIKSMIAEAVSAVDKQKPLVDASPQLEVKSEPKSFVDMIVEAKMK
ncbi:MAG: hypothetical protein K0A90_00235 [Methanosarcinaceae archaeon]|nr:hypothetical protein [Methanosarcinaceae archaeon]